MDVWVDAALIFAAEVIGLAAEVAVLAANGESGVIAEALEELLGVHWCGVYATLLVVWMQGGSDSVRVEHEGLAIVEGGEGLKQGLIASSGGRDGALRDECEEQVAELHVDLF